MNLLYFIAKVKLSSTHILLNHFFIRDSYVLHYVLIIFCTQEDPNILYQYHVTLKNLYLN